MKTTNPRPSEQRPTVFVVDDDPSVRRGVGRLLRAAGHRVETFGSAAEFLAHEIRGRPGCAVLDLKMPEIDGFELQRRLPEAGHDLPVVFITGHGDIPMAVRAMKNGAVDFLAKPFDDDELLAAVERALAVPGPSR